MGTGGYAGDTYPPWGGFWPIGALAWGGYMSPAAGGGCTSPTAGDREAAPRLRLRGQLSASGFLAGFEFDLLAGGLGRLEEPAEGGEDLLQVGAVSDDSTFEGGKLLPELGVSAGKGAQVDEGADDEDAHFHRTGTAEHGCHHDRTVLGEGPGQVSAPAVLQT